MSSKVKLVVGKQPNQQSFLVAPAVLAFHSEVFEAMFFGPNADSHDVIEFPEDNPLILSILVTYCITFELQLRTVNEALEAYHLFDKYLMFDAKSKCVDYVIQGIKPDNVLKVLEEAEELQEDHLAYNCWLHILKNTEEVLLKGLGLAKIKTLLAVVHQNIMSCAKTCGDSVSRSISLYVEGNCKEINVYKGIVRWGENELNRRKDFSCLHKVVQPLISEIRFLTMSPREFAEMVCGNGILKDREELEVLRAISHNTPIVTPYLNNSREERKKFCSDVCYLTNCKERANSYQQVIIECFRAKSHNLYVYGMLLRGNSSFQGKCTLTINNITRQKEVKTTLSLSNSTYSCIPKEVLSKSAVFVARGEVFEVTLQNEVENLPCCTYECNISPLLERVLDSSPAKNKNSHSVGILALPLDV